MLCVGLECVYGRNLQDATLTARIHSEPPPVLSFSLIVFPLIFRWPFRGNLALGPPVLDPPRDEVSRLSALTHHSRVHDEVPKKRGLNPSADSADLACFTFAQVHL